jgi:putative tryptophan/tyrosine transport system substrate-binding protein
MRRRDLIVLIGGGVAALPFRTLAQRPGKIPTVGILWHAGGPEQEGPYFTAMLDGFRDLGYVADQNIKFEHRFPNEVSDRFRSMAAELVALKVDVLVGVGVNASPVVKDATDTIPVVFTLAADPVATKLVESLSRPGGNATGLTNFQVELSAKRLQLLKDMLPNLSRVGLLVNPNEPPARRYIAEGEVTAAKLGLVQQVFEARTIDEIEPAFAAMEHAGMQAVIVGAGGLFYQARTRIPQWALVHHLPICVWSKETFDPGALMSYGCDQLDLIHRTASYVDKILKGARPSNLPVEQPTKLQFLFNAKVARLLGLNVPTAILLRADEVVE